MAQRLSSTPEEQDLRADECSTASTKGRGATRTSKTTKYTKYSKISSQALLCCMQTVQQFYREIFCCSQESDSPSAWGKWLWMEVNVLLSHLQVVTLTAGCKHRRSQAKPPWQTHISECPAYIALAWLTVACCTKHTEKNQDFMGQKWSNGRVKKTDTESRRDLLQIHMINKGKKKRSQT